MEEYGFIAEVVWTSADLVWMSADLVRLIVVSCGLVWVSVDLERIRADLVWVSADPRGRHLSGLSHCTLLQPVASMSARESRMPFCCSFAYTRTCVMCILQCDNPER